MVGWGVAVARGATAATILLASMALDAGPSAALRARGLELGYNLDYPDALAAFRLAIAADPDDSRAYCARWPPPPGPRCSSSRAPSRWTTTSVRRARMSRARPRRRTLDRAFHDDLDRAQAIAEAQLRAHPERRRRAFCRSDPSYGFRASYIATVEGRVVGSLGPGRRAYREHQRVLELDPSRKDAGLIVGLYRYAVASLSGAAAAHGESRRLRRRPRAGARARRGRRALSERRQPNALFTLLADVQPRVALRRRARGRSRICSADFRETDCCGSRPAAPRFGRAGRPTRARRSKTGLAHARRTIRGRGPPAKSRAGATRYGAALVALKDVVPAERELRAALARRHARLGPGPHPRRARQARRSRRRSLACAATSTASPTACAARTTTTTARTKPGR